MKLKKTLSGVLAAAMVVSLTPAMAFATTTNTVSAVPTVATNEVLPNTSINLEVKDSVAWTSGETGTIKLTFGNAKWVKNPAEGPVNSGAGNTTIEAKAAVSAVAAKYSFAITTAAAVGDKIVVANPAVEYLVTGTGDATAAQQATKIAEAITTEGNYTASATGSKVTMTKAAPGAVTNAPTVSVDKGTNTSATGVVSAVSEETAGANAIPAATFGFSADAVITNVISVTDNSIEFSYKLTANKAKDSVLTLQFLNGALKSESDESEVTVSIDGLDSKISSSTVTIATMGKSNTVSSVVGKVKTIGRESNKTLEGKIEIRESAVNSITDDQVIKLTLPKGYSWGTGTAVSGTLFTGDLLTPQGSASAVTSYGDYYLANSGRSLYLYLSYAGANAQREVAIITPQISVGKTAVEGDITVDLSSYYVKGGNSVSDADGLVVAKYGTETVSVYTAAEDEIPTIVAGYEKTSKDKYNWIQITLKEGIAGSLTHGKQIDIELPEEVQVVQDGTAAIKTTLDKDANIDDANTFGKLDAALIEWEDESSTATSKDGNMSEFTLTVPTYTAPGPGDKVNPSETWSANANTWSIFVPVTVRANFTGDITATIKGSKAGVDETELVVAKAISPITVEAETTDVKNGVQGQSVSDITITENVAGYLKDGKNITLALDDLGLTGGLVFDDADVTVTAGDLEIGKTTVKAGVITIPVKTASTKVSTIEITNVTATLNRTLPEGGYDIKVGSTALIDNGAYDDKEFNKTPVKVKNYINIVTPADSVTVSEKVDAKFVIGEASYTNNGTATEMDAAAYIDSHNRTMVPIRYVANACGISENDIRWEAGSQTAIINGLNTVVTVKMGSNKLQTSTGEITMDTVAVNNNGRIYVPVRYIANALGANVSWDAATKTVTLTK